MKSCYDPTPEEVHQRIMEDGDIGDATNNADYVLFNAEDETRRKIKRERLLNVAGQLATAAKTREDATIVEILTVLIDEVMR